MSIVNHYAIEVCIARIHIMFIVVVFCFFVFNLIVSMDMRNKEMNKIKTACNKQQRETMRASRRVRQPFLVQCCLTSLCDVDTNKSMFVNTHTHAITSMHWWANTFPDKQKDKHISEKKHTHTHTVIYSHVSHNLQAVANWIERQEKRQETTGTEINRSCSLRCWLRKSVR